MATNNKFIVERTNVLAADVTLGVSYAALDANDFGFFGKAGETYEFEARVAYSAVHTRSRFCFSNKHHRFEPSIYSWCYYAISRRNG